jgi:histidine ammonia-lyase
VSGELEVRTRSIPTAAHLMTAGFEPLRIMRREGGAMFCFSSAAEPALLAFIRAKQTADALAEAAK